MELIQIKSIVNKIFIEEFELSEEKLKDDALIFETLGLDSLDIVDLVVALEKAFNVKIKSRETLASIKSLGDIYQFISNEQKKLAAGA